LEFWCNKGYDYIGAPWFEDWNNATENSNFIGLGNGGFSLRKVSSAIKVLNSFKRIEKLSLFWSRQKKIHYNFKGKLGSYWQLIKYFLHFENTTFYLFNNYEGNEDFFWSKKADSLFTWYRISNLEDAIKFSFEVNPTLLYKLNNNQLPFGCHAYLKYEPEFWKQFIEIL
jgi:hypothetical protein